MSWTMVGKSGTPVPSPQFWSNKFRDEFKDYVRAELEELLTSPQGGFSAVDCEKILQNFDNGEKIQWCMQIHDLIVRCGQDARLSLERICLLKEEWMTRPSEMTRDSLGLRGPGETYWR